MYSLKENVKHDNEDKVIHITKRLIQEIKFKQRFPPLRKGLIDELFLTSSISHSCDIIKEESSDSFRTLVLIS